MKRFITTCCLAVAFVGTAQATMIVDTGVDWPWTGGGGFDRYNFYAGRFNTLEDYSINSIAAYFSSRIPGKVDVSLHYGNGNVPGEVIYTTTETLYEWDGPLKWNGPSGLDWKIAAGTYWVSFKPQADNLVGMGFSGNMGYGAIHPMDEYALGTPKYSWYDFGPNVYDGVNMAVQISATPITTPSQVSEPISSLLVGIGFMSVLLLQTRINKTQLSKKDTLNYFIEKIISV